MKNSVDLGECFPPRPSAPVDNTLLDLQNSSFPTQPHSIVANHTNTVFCSPEPREEVCCLQLNFEITKLSDYI